MGRLDRIAERVVAEEVRDFDSLRRGDYVRSKMGEGYVVGFSFTGVVISMKKGAREGKRVDRSDAVGVYDEKSKRWVKLS